MAGRLTAEERKERARVAAAARWQRPGAQRRASIAAKAGLRRQLIREVDPDGKMDPEELEVALKHAAAALAARARAARARKLREAAS